MRQFNETRTTAESTFKELYFNPSSVCTNSLRNKFESIEIFIKYNFDVFITNEKSSALLFQMSNFKLVGTEVLKR